MAGSELYRIARMAPKSDRQIGTNRHTDKRNTAAGGQAEYRYRETSGMPLYDKKRITAV